MRIYAQYWIDFAHMRTYNKSQKREKQKQPTMRGIVKKKELERKLKEAGFSQIHGAKHDRWVKKGHPPITVPRHREINERLALKILKDAGIN